MGSTEREVPYTAALYTPYPLYSGGIVVRPWAVREADSKWRAENSGLSRPPVFKLYRYETGIW